MRIADVSVQFVIRLIADVLGAPEYPIALTALNIALHDRPLLSGVDPFGARRDVCAQVSCRYDRDTIFVQA